MGNWRTVNMTGTMTAVHAQALWALLDRNTRPGEFWPGWDKPYACLSFNAARPGLAGIGAWPAERVDRCGNLAERNYSVEDVADALRALVYVAPSMLLKVHCGGDWESGECIATVTVGEGLVAVGPPEQAKVDGPPEAQVAANLLRNLMH